MEFYARVLGGKLSVMPFSQAPDVPAGAGSLVMHANILAQDGPR
jgi:hypothetical protein